MHKVALLTLGVFYLINVAFSQAHTSNDIATNLNNFSGLGNKVHQLPNVAADVMAQQQIFSGYFNVNTTKNLYYYFVESKRGASSKDPLLLFLTGGTSNSGLSFAFGVGGPLKINPDMTVTSNSYSWNRKANVLYLDATAGSGYSYDTDKNYNLDDHMVGENNFEALQQFYVKFPYMKQRELIILGQNDGGIYASALSKLIVDWNQKHSTEEQIKLTTIGVSNGNNEFSDFVSPSVINSLNLRIDTNYQIDDQKISSLNESCQLMNNDGSWNGKFSDDLDGTCRTFFFYMNQYVFKHCMEQNVTVHDTSKKCVVNKNELTTSINESFNNYNQTTIKQPLPIPLSIFCLNNDAHFKYFNRKDVKEALFVPLEATWADFRMIPGYNDIVPQPRNDIPILNYDDDRIVISGIWKELLKNGIRGVIYHGLHDLLNPAIATTIFQDTLNLPVLEKRKEWYYVNGNSGKSTLGGSVVQYQNLTSIFVEGEGSIVGSNVPEKSQKIIEQYILQDNA